MLPTDRDTIRERGQKIKRQLADTLDNGAQEWGIFTLVMVVAFASFGLGRLSIQMAPKPLISLSEASQSAAAAPMAPGGLFVASRTGAVYYYPWCGGVRQIRPENQRWFASEEDAKAAGYRPAKNCKGLVAE